MSQDRQCNTTSRRAVLSGAIPAAAVALAAGTALAIPRTDEVDPIFEVIERHRAALELFDETHEHFEEMSNLYPIEPNPEDFPTWPMEKKMAWNEAEAARRKGSPRDIAYHRWDDQSDVVDRITDELVATTPTTAAGVAALISYWSEIMDEETINRDLQGTQEFLEKLGEALGRGQA
jgi:hypothetical protein